MLPNAGIHSPSHGSKIRRLTSYDMSLGMQWMALICRAAFSGPYGRRNIPFGVLMLGKEIGFNWTNVVSLPRLELSTFSMPSALTHNDPGEQQQVKLWVFLLAILRKILISSRRRETNSRSTPMRIPAERRTIAEKRGADEVMDAGEESGSGDERVVGPGYLTTPLLILNAPSWRPRRWPLTRTGLTQHMRRSENCLKACMTLTPGSMQGVSPATMRLESSCVMDRRSCVNWYTCLAIGHWPGSRSHLEGLASKLIDSLRDTAFSDLGYQPRPGCTQWKGYPDSHALDIDLCVVFWTMPQRSCLTMTLNLS